MASELPSVRTYLDPTDYDVLTEVARVTGSSRSSVVREMVEQCTPLFRLIIDAHERLEAVESLPAETIQRLVEDLEGSMRIASLVEEQASRSLRRVHEDPPPSNRGVRR